MLSVMSAVFPAGERYFMDSVRQYRDQINDPILLAQISGFIAQVAIAHSSNLLAKLPPTQRLACTVIMEHITAVLAEAWLTHDEFRETSDPEVLKLWTWHALEELEHKSVALMFAKGSATTLTLKDCWQYP